jgi:hypothetical protein
MDGFQVNLTQLETYTNALVQTQKLYDQIEDQLDQADLKIVDPFFDTLIGHPQYAGPQSDFTEACRTFLSTYRDLYTEIHALNSQISGKLNYMVQEFVKTHELYQQLDRNSATLINGLHDRLSGGAYNGATGA